MKFIIFIAVLFSLNAAESRPFKQHHLDWGSLGHDIDKNDQVTIYCVDGVVNKIRLPQPNVSFRIRVVDSNITGKKEIRASLVVIDRTEELMNVTPKSPSSIKYCGKEFISKVIYGAHLSYHVTVDDAEAKKVKELTVEESATMTIARFDSEIEKLFQSLKTVSGGGVSFIGTDYAAMDLPRAQAFEYYKSLYIRDPKLRRVVDGEISKYPWVK